MQLEIIGITIPNICQVLRFITYTFFRNDS